MDKHTPTPWWFEGCTILADATLQGRTQPTTIAVFAKTFAISPEEQFANARYAANAVNSHASLTEAVRVLSEALEKATTLASLVTVRDVIEGGDKAIEAAGINPWAMNEGLATGDESISIWRFEDALTRAKELLK